MIEMHREEFLKKLGEHLKKLREERNLTQSDVASLIGKDRQSYQRIEMGTTNPTIWYLKNIADALNISLKDLIDFRQIE